ncbi:hypothetical protein HGRIS_002400 [Hohenbuehelia grisea]|uniref:Uncharacterized protein n=1 Tax=Hohenbuehelia grisea TaxID=104357 RepID=A0ABR3JMG0_9AGAR
MAPAYIPPAIRGPTTFTIVLVSIGLVSCIIAMIYLGVHAARIFYNRDGQRTPLCLRRILKSHQRSLQNAGIDNSSDSVCGSGSSFHKPIQFDCFLESQHIEKDALTQLTDEQPRRIETYPSAQSTDERPPIIRMPSFGQPLSARFPPLMRSKDTAFLTEADSMHPEKSRRSSKFCLLPAFVEDPLDSSSEHLDLLPTPSPSMIRLWTRPPNENTCHRPVDHRFFPDLLARSEFLGEGIILKPGLARSSDRYCTPSDQTSIRPGRAIVEQWARKKIPLMRNGPSKLHIMTTK